MKAAASQNICDASNICVPLTSKPDSPPIFKRLETFTELVNQPSPCFSFSVEIMLAARDLRFELGCQKGEHTDNRSTKTHHAILIFSWNNAAFGCMRQSPTRAQRPLSSNLRQSHTSSHHLRVDLFFLLWCAPLASEISAGDGAAAADIKMPDEEFGLVLWNAPAQEKESGRMYIINCVEYLLRRTYTLISEQSVYKKRRVEIYCIDGERFMAAHYNERWMCAAPLYESSFICFGSRTTVSQI
jgi:hypothetical protein